MKRALVALAMLIAAPASAQGTTSGWTVAHRAPLSPHAPPLDLASLASPHEERVRIRLSGSYSFLLDGSEIDALGARRAGHTDVSGPSIVVLPPGAELVESDPIAHRYTVEIPRATSMPVAIDASPLAMRYLITASEARAQLQGAIFVEHLVPPPPPPAAITVAAREASELSPIVWIVSGASGLFFFGLAFLAVRRRRDPLLALARRARRAQRAIERECALLGPAFDPVAASTARLLEAAERSERHRREVERALSRTAWTSSATNERARLHEQSESARRRLAQIAARLEQTATTLAGRRADALRAGDVDSLLGELGDDLDAAVSAEDELAHLAA